MACPKSSLEILNVLFAFVRRVFLSANRDEEFEYVCHRSPEDRRLSLTRIFSLAALSEELQTAVYL